MGKDIIDYSVFQIITFWYAFSFIITLVFGFCEMAIQTFYKGKNKILLFLGYETPMQNLNVFIGFSFVLYLLILGIMVLIG